MHCVTMNVYRAECVTELGPNISIAGSRSEPWQGHWVGCSQLPPTQKTNLNFFIYIFLIYICNTFFKVNILGDAHIFGEGGAGCIFLRRGELGVQFVFLGIYVIVLYKYFGIKS